MKILVIVKKASPMILKIVRTEMKSHFKTEKSIKDNG
jgi:hypothetical protein